MPRAKAAKPGAILWGYWANQMCLGGGICLFMSSLISFHPVFADKGQDEPSTDLLWRFHNVWSLLASILIMVVEYPISKRRPKGLRRREEERPYQLELKFVDLVYYTKIFQTYIVRFIVYIVLIAPLTISFPCLLSVVFIFLGALLYFYAGGTGEQWNPGWADPKKKVLKELDHPALPPPRLATVAANPNGR